MTTHGPRSQRCGPQGHHPAEHRHLRPFVAITMIIVFRASRNNKTAADYYAAGRSFTGAAERHRHRRRLPLGGILPRHHRRHRDQRLRRLPLLHRLPRRLARRPAARRRTAAQHRQVHHGRRALVPAQAAPRAHRGGHLHARRLLLLPAGADGRSRQPRLAAARHQRQGRTGPGDHRRRRADDHLRADRRHEGHHLGADHQGRAADRGRRGDDRLGARDQRLQLLDAARRRGRDRRQPDDPQPGPAVRQVRDLQARLPLARPGAGARHRGPAARADALLHGADREGGPQVGRVGHLAHRHLLPVHARARLRRRGAGRAPTPSRRRRAASNSAAPLLAFDLGGPLLLGFISAVAFATILAVVAGLTITAAASFAHDIYASVIEEGQGRRRHRGQGRPSHRRRDRHPRHHRRHRRERPERGVPRGAGLRGRGIRQPADDPVLAVLEAGSPPRARCGACTAASRRRSS